MVASSGERSNRLHTWLLPTCVLVMAGEWFLLVSSTRPHEILVGLVSVVVSAVYVYFVARSETLKQEFHASDLASAWRIPWHLVSGIAEITRVLVKDMLGMRAGSYYRVSGFQTARYDARMTARNTLAIAYTTIAPNFIILGIDADQSRMLFHQIKRSGVPKMTRSLGAQP